MKIVLDVWRQPDSDTAGRFEAHDVDAAPEMSLLEVLDRLNEDLVEAGAPPVAFDSDCREGICGSCGITVDGRPHGPEANTPSCRQHLRSFDDGAHITLEPFRSGSFPVVCDLAVDRSALDRLVAAGGFVSTNAGTATDADALAVPHGAAEQALDMAACIGCGACVAACPNGAVELFVGAKHHRSWPGPPRRAACGLRRGAAAAIWWASSGGSRHRCGPQLPGRVGLTDPTLITQEMGCAPGVHGVRQVGVADHDVGDPGRDLGSALGRRAHPGREEFLTRHALGLRHR